MSEQKNLVAIGKIVGGFGLEGLMKIAPLTHSAERFTVGLDVWVGSNEAVRMKTKIRVVRTHGSTLLIGVEGIASRTEVDSVKDGFLFVDGEDRIELPERTWFINDIVGISVSDEEGNELGVVADVLFLPAHHVYVVRRKGREILLPAVADVVRSVDTARRTMVVRIPDGLLDVYGGN